MIKIERRKSRILIILALALVFMIGFTVMAFQVLMWQSADISVSIISETEEGTSEVTISVLNTAGSTLLFYENAEMTGKIEYLSENGWVEFCDVSYTANNTSAISSQYGGTFAELEPGENWDVSVPEEKIADMKNGTYRIKMTYITENDYNNYLDIAFSNRDESEIVSEDDSSEDISDISEISSLRPIIGKVESEEEESSIEETFLAESECEIFVKTFEYIEPEDFVGEISIDDSDIEKGKFENSPKARINSMN